MIRIHQDGSITIEAGARVMRIDTGGFSLTATSAHGTIVVSDKGIEAR
jgi:hypothetical protein